jgi:hypothetical protein
MRSTLMAVLGLAVVMAAVAAQTPKSPQKPGKWQIKMEMEMPGMPMKMPPFTTEECVTEQDLADPQKSVPSDPKSKCTVSDYKVKEKTISWKVDCPSQKSTGTGEITYTDDSYTGAMKMKMPDREMSMKYSGKWLGACTK